MSLYNSIFGVDSSSWVLLACLDLTANDVPRYRDCFIKDNTIVIHTRTGGGNREEYEEENEDLRKHPNYLNDADDEYDCTYANFFFSFPERYKDELTILSKNCLNEMPSDRWKNLFEELEKNK